MHYCVIVSIGTKDCQAAIKPHDNCLVVYVLQNTNQDSLKNLENCTYLNLTELRRQSFKLFFVTKTQNWALQRYPTQRERQRSVNVCDSCSAVQAVPNQIC